MFEVEHFSIVQNSGSDPVRLYYALMNLYRCIWEYIFNFVCVILVFYGSISLTLSVLYSVLWEYIFNFVCVILVFSGSISLTLSVLFWCFLGVYLKLSQSYTGVLWEYIFSFVCVILVFYGVYL